LLEDNRTKIGVYPKGGGRGAIVMRGNTDGGLTWSEPEVITQHPEARLCEPCIIRSPDGNQVAILMREESRRFNFLRCLFQ